MNPQPQKFNSTEAILSSRKINADGSFTPSRIRGSNLPLGPKDYIEVEFVHQENQYRFKLSFTRPWQNKDAGIPAPLLNLNQARGLACNEEFSRLEEEVTARFSNEVNVPCNWVLVPDETQVIASLPAPEPNSGVEYVTDPIEYFLRNRREILWIKNSESWKMAFRLHLKVLKVYIDNQADDRLLNSFAYRLGLGYWGIGIQNGIPSGIMSTDALENAIATTNDHVIGAQLIGKTVHDAFADCGYDEDFMVETWLYQNIWLWMTIRVTKREHHRDNILKTVDNLEEKKKLTHYRNVSRLVAVTRRKKVVSQNK